MISFNYKLKLNKERPTAADTPEIGNCTNFAFFSNWGFTNPKNVL